MIEKDDQIETLVANLRYFDAAIKIEEAGTDFESTYIWETIFPEYSCDPECIVYDDFYSDELSASRMVLMNMLLERNVYPECDVIKSIIRSASHLRACREKTWGNYMSTLTCLAESKAYSYDAVLRYAMWYQCLEVADGLIESGPEGLSATGLGHKLVDTALLGNWPTILGNPIGRLLRHDLYAAFRKEHAPCFEKVNDIFKHAQKRGMLDINEQNSKGETPLLLLCKEAFPQGLRMPYVKELISKLIAMGADTSVVDNAGKTGYDYAKEKRAPRAILNLLRPL